MKAKGLWFLAGLALGLAVFFAALKMGFSRSQNSDPWAGVLATLQGKPLRASGLTESAQERLRRLDQKRKEDIFFAEFEHFRQAQQVVKDQAYVQLIGQGLEAPLVGAATEAEALSLFQASDPKASAKDLESLKPKLMAYIEEVKKKEALEDFLKKQESSGKLKFHILAPKPPAGLQLSAEGFPSVGTPQSQVTVYQFVDFLCESCADYNLKFAQIVERFRLSAQFVFLPFPYSRPDKSIGLARGSLCAHAQGKYLDYHMAVLALGQQVVDANVLGIAKSSGLGLSAFQNCYKSGEGVAALLASSEALAKRVGLVATPVSFAFFSDSEKAPQDFVGIESLSALEGLLQKASSSGGQAEANSLKKH